MLPDIHLDQNTFEELMEKAKSRIAGCYPRWTDFNYHDPGITLAELFAWLEEIQQYELNHIGDAHRRQYLKLLGESARHSRPARAFVCVPEGEALSVYAGTRMDASGAQIVHAVLICRYGGGDHTVKNAPKRGSSAPLRGGNGVLPADV